MTTFAKRIALASVKTDPSAANWASALRRGAVVVTVLAVAYAVSGASAAIHGATAALLVGLLDKGRSPRETWRVMLSATALFCAVTLINGWLHELPGASVLFMALLALLAFAGGVSFGVDTRAPQVFVFGALLTAANINAPIGPAEALHAAAVIALAAGLQTLVSWLAAPFVGDRPERRKIRSALLATAAVADEIARGGSHLHEAVTQASAAMAAASDFVGRSDLSADRRQRYSRLLGDADLLRMEARAYASRQRLGVAVPTDDGTRAAFAAAASVCRLAAASLDGGRPAGADSPAAAELTATVARLREQSPAGGTRIARFVRDVSISLGGHLAGVVADRDTHRQARRGDRRLGERIADALDPRSSPFKYGIRMAAAAVFGELVSKAAGLPHGSWVAVTTMMLLRPDIGPTAPRIVARAVGTTIGAALALLLGWLCGGSPPLLIAAVGVAAVLMYAVTSVNFGFVVILITATVLLIMSLAEPDTLGLARTRWVDVLVGCVIGTVFALVFPLWRRTSLAADAAAYGDAVATWFDSIASAAAVEPADRQTQVERMRACSKRAREARLTVDATLSVSLLEPGDTRALQPATTGNLLNAVRECSHGGIAAETLLRHGVPANERARADAEASARALAEVAETLRSDHPPAEPEAVPPMGPYVPTDDRLGQVLAAARELAEGARAQARVAASRH